MKHFLVITLTLFSLTVLAQKTKTVEGEYTYHAPENVTLEQARRTALERAKIQALADEFGTIVSQTELSRVENVNGKSDVNFLSFGGTEVKGEWIETIGEPIYNIRYEGNVLVISCSVKGKAREIVSAQIDFTAKVLRNGTEEKFESAEFRNGDDLYLLFQSPVKGYLAVYLMDADGQAFCLLPYRKQTDGIYPIKANQRYVFFNERLAPSSERPQVDEYVMTTERSSEYNQICVIFSPNQFVKAVDGNADEGLPRQLSSDDFNKWLVKCRKHDEDMNVKIISIMIEK
ncbi:MAG: DUF4384 domain-containing protein [Prevotella sp.]|nr:DUF4384 domain-containing protein [Prevotella sp.]